MAPLGYACNEKEVRGPSESCVMALHASSKHTGMDQHDAAAGIGGYTSLTAHHNPSPA